MRDTQIDILESYMRIVHSVSIGFFLSETRNVIVIRKYLSILIVMGIVVFEFINYSGRQLYHKVIACCLWAVSSF